MQKTKTRIRPTPFKTLLQPHVTPANAQFARKQASEIFGSISAYVNTLIANDRGVKPAKGRWQVKAPKTEIRRYL